MLRDANELIQQFFNGSNPGLGSKHLQGDIYYSRGRNGARVFYLIYNGAMEILGKADKSNEQKVINLIKVIINKREPFMKINNIIFPTALEEISDISNDNIDIFVELEDGCTYTLVVTTLKNISQLMEQDNKDYFTAGPPMIIVKELTYDCINLGLKSFCEGNAYWLKEYYLSGSFSIELLDEMIKKEQG